MAETPQNSNNQNSSSIANIKEKVIHFYTRIKEKIDKISLNRQRNILFISSSVLLVLTILFGSFWIASASNKSARLLRASDVDEYGAYSYNAEAFISFNQNPMSVDLSTKTNNVEFFLTGQVNRQSKLFRAPGGLNLGSVPFSLQYYINDNQPYYHSANFNSKYIVNDTSDFDTALESETIVLQNIIFKDIIRSSQAITSTKDEDGIMQYNILLSQQGAKELAEILLQIFRKKYVFIDLDSRLGSLSEFEGTDVRTASYTLYVADGQAIGAELSANIKLSAADVQTADNISMVYMISYFDINLEKSIDMPELTQENSVYYKELESAVG